MSDAAAKMERQDRILAELSELGLTLARGLHAKALAAETAEEAQALGLAFHRISRSVRQTIALEAKLDRERRRQDHDDRRDAEQRDEAKARQRKAQVRSAVERAIWAEAEGDEAELLICELDDRLGDDALAEGFLDAPIETLIARIQGELGLAASGLRSATAAPTDGAQGFAASAGSGLDARGPPPEGDRAAEGPVPHTAAFNST